MQTVSTPIRVLAILTIIFSAASMFLRAQGHQLQGIASLLGTVFAVCLIVWFIYERFIQKKQ